MARIKRIRSSWDDENEENIYSGEFRKRLLENDELTPLEDAFMQGWEEAD